MNIYVYCRLRNYYSFLLCISRHVSAHMSHHRVRLGFISVTELDTSTDPLCMIVCILTSPDDGSYEPKHVVRYITKNCNSCEGGNKHIYLFMVIVYYSIVRSRNRMHPSRMKFTKYPVRYSCIFSVFHINSVTSSSLYTL
jgi:hypothetical protein